MVLFRFGSGSMSASSCTVRLTSHPSSARKSAPMRFARARSRMFFQGVLLPQFAETFWISMRNAARSRRNGPSRRFSMPEVLMGARKG